MSLSSLASALTRLRRLGADVPDDIQADYDALLAARGDVQQLIADGDTMDIGEAILAALLAAADPYDDPAVLRAATHRVVAAALPNVNGTIATRARRLLDDAAPKLLDALRPAFDDAAAAITKARGPLGDADLADRDSIVRLGPKAGAAWAQVHSAHETIRRVCDYWSSLAVDVSSVPRHPHVVIFAAINADEFVAAGHFRDYRHGRQGVTPWDCVRAGWPLRLATPAEATAAHKALWDAFRRTTRPNDEEPERSRREAVVGGVAG